MTLTVLTVPGHPDYVSTGCKITLATAGEFYLCNPFEEVRDAVKLGEPFEAQTIKALKASGLLVNPTYVVSLERV